MTTLELSCGVFAYLGGELFLLLLRRLELLIENRKLLLHTAQLLLLGLVQVNCKK